MIEALCMKCACVCLYNTLCLCRVKWVHLPLKSWNICLHFIVDKLLSCIFNTSSFSLSHSHPFSLTFCSCVGAVNAKKGKSTLHQVDITNNTISASLYLIAQSMQVCALSLFTNLESRSPVDQTAAVKWPLCHIWTHHSTVCTPQNYSLLSAGSEMLSASFWWTPYC